MMFDDVCIQCFTSLKIRCVVFIVVPDSDMGLFPQSSGGMGKNYTQVDVQEKEKREGAGGNVAGLTFINMNKP